MATLSTSLLAAVVVLALLVSPIACSRKPRPKTKPISHRQAPLPARTSHKLTTATKSPPTTPHHPPPTMVPTAGCQALVPRGACGYQTAVGKQSFNSMIAVESALLYRGGEACDACYEVKCTSNAACSSKPVTIVITDLSPGGLFHREVAHFDMSGTVMGTMAKPDMGDKVRAGGVVRIQYRRVPCKYPGVNVAFKVDQGANPFYFNVLIEFEDADGNLNTVDLMLADNREWTPMAHNWGATWCLNNGRRLRAPFGLRLTSDSGRVLAPNNAIPVAWKLGKTYCSLVNYP
ncbi:Expansin-B4 [Zea mays]|uniref:Expansin-B4 n=1 Tax=Zea mays TaxID=4577 RepID=A0A1D6HYG3_MAIZE|nr:Expansin-B4 [Zea mays]